MLEKTIEHKLRMAVITRGGMCVKFVSPGLAGVPDRLVLLPGGRLCFVELKAPGRKPRAIQKVMLAKLSGLGFRAEVIDSEDQIDGLLDRMEADA